MNPHKIAGAVARGIAVLPSLVFAYVAATATGIALAVQNAGHQALVPSLGMGFSPSSQNSAQTPQAAQVIFYNNQFTKNLAPNTPAQRLCARRPMGLNAGQKYRDYINPLLGINVVQAAEGTVGTGISLTPLSVDFTLGQWADFVNFSDFVLATTIDPLVVNVEKEMAKRLGRSVQQITLAQFDALRTLDTSVGALDATSASTSQTRNLWTEAAGSLRGRNVQPMPGMGGFGALIHPFFTSDMLIDTSNNSVSDILKHTAEGQMALKELPVSDSGEAKVISFGGITFLETTALTTSTPSWAGGKTAIRSYLAGEEAILAIRLGRPDRTDIGDGMYQNLKLWRGKYEMGQSNDPAGMIGGATSYNVVGTWGPPADTTARARCFDYVPQTT